FQARSSAIAIRRPCSAAARHRPGKARARMGADDCVARGPRSDDRLLSPLCGLAAGQDLANKIAVLGCYGLSREPFDPGCPEWRSGGERSFKAAAKLLRVLGVAQELAIPDYPAQALALVRHDRKSARGRFEETVAEG